LNLRPPGPQPERSGCLGRDPAAWSGFELVAVAPSCAHFAPRIAPRRNTSASSTAGAAVPHGCFRAFAKASRPSTLLLAPRPHRALPRPTLGRSHSGESGRVAFCFPGLLRFTAHRPRPPDKPCHRSRAGHAANAILFACSTPVTDVAFGSACPLRTTSQAFKIAFQPLGSSCRPMRALRGDVCAVLPRTAGVWVLVVLLGRCAGRSVITARVRLRRGWSLLRAARSRRRLSRTPCGARSRRTRCKHVRRPRSAALGR
jgi:hypothetical protein